MPPRQKTNTSHNTERKAALPHRALKPRPETLEKRAEILRAAVEVFGTNGYSQATLQEIAERVGMTHAGVLHHFGSKQQLLLEAVRYRDTHDLPRPAVDHMPQGLEQFRHLTQTAELNMQRPGIVQTFVTLSADAIANNGATREYFESRYSTLRDQITENFRALCAQRGIASNTAEMAATSILAAMDGIQYQWLMDPDGVNLAATTDFAIQAIVRAVLDPAQSTEEATAE